MCLLYSEEGKAEAGVAGTENEGEGVQGEAGEPAKGSSYAFSNGNAKP